ncbi:MAG TPA: hypothetical protein VHT00_06380, partial [Stellaceae bacterium]|nr:hypothetical protein [Stellaceae bacterium]
MAGAENALARIAARVQRARSPLRGAAAIGQAVGAVLGRRHMAKHFQISIADDAFSFAQNPLSITAEAALDGTYVIRTTLRAAQSDAAATVRAYKSLSGVEHAFRSLKTVDLELRPVFPCFAGSGLISRLPCVCVDCRRRVLEDPKYKGGRILNSWAWGRLSTSGSDLNLAGFPAPFPSHLPGLLVACDLARRITKSPWSSTRTKPIRLHQVWQPASVDPLHPGVPAGRGAGARQRT